MFEIFYALQMLLQMYMVLISMVAILIGYVVCTAVWRSKHWERRGFPHLKSPLFVGESGRTLLLTKSVAENIIDIYFLLKSKGLKYAGFMAIQTPVLMIVDLNLASNILITHHSYFTDRDLINEPHMDNYFTILFKVGQLWKHLRLKLVNFFTKAKRKSKFNDIRHRTDEILSFAKTNEPVEMRELIGRFAINVIGSSMFNLKIDSQLKRKESQIFFDLTDTFFRPSPFQLWKTKFLENFTWIAKLLKVQKCDSKTRNFFLGLVRNMLKNSGENGPSKSNYIQGPLMLRESESMSKVLEEVNRIKNKQATLNAIPQFNNITNFDITENLLAAHVYHTFVEGGEAIATSLSFALFNIANHPEVQNTLRKDLDDAINENGFTFEAVTTLPYLDNTLKESLRFHPSFEAMNRICVKDYTIPGTSHVIKEGDLVIIPYIGYHFDPEYWDDVNTFNPDRFIDLQMVDPVQYTPFGIGPRKCVGTDISVLIMKVFLASIISKYHVKVSEKTRRPYRTVKTSFTSHLEGGMWLELEERKLK